MRFLIAGAGGLGTVLAGYLSRAGHDVTLLVRPERAKEFSALAVSISGLATFTAPVTLAWSAEHLTTYDTLLLCVKARDTQAVLTQVRAAHFDSAVSLQNGVAKDDALVAALGRQRVLGGLTSVGGTLLSAGQALHSLAGPTLVGELDRTVSARAQAVAAAIADSGLPASCVDNIVVREWAKLALFLRTAPVCALTHRDIATVLLDPDLVHVCLRNAREVTAVALAEGHDIREEPAWITPSVGFGADDAAMLQELANVARYLQDQGVPLYPSLAQDVMAGRPSELEATAGDALVRAARHGIDVPSLTTCVRLLRAMTRGRDTFKNG